MQTTCGYEYHDILLQAYNFVISYQLFHIISWRSVTIDNISALNLETDTCCFVKTTFNVWFHRHIKCEQFDIFPRVDA